MGKAVDLGTFYGGYAAKGHSLKSAGYEDWNRDWYFSSAADQAYSIEEVFSYYVRGFVARTNYGDKSTQRSDEFRERNQLFQMLSDPVIHQTIGTKVPISILSGRWGEAQQTLYMMSVLERDIELANLIFNQYYTYRKTSDEIRYKVERDELDPRDLAKRDSYGNTVLDYTLESDYRFCDHSRRLIALFPIEAFLEKNEKGHTPLMTAIMAFADENAGHPRTSEAVSIIERLEKENILKSMSWQDTGIVEALERENTQVASKLIEYMDADQFDDQLHGLLQESLLADIIDQFEEKYLPYREKKMEAERVRQEKALKERGLLPAPRVIELQAPPEFLSYDEAKAQIQAAIESGRYEDLENVCSDLLRFVGDVAEYGAALGAQHRERVSQVAMLLEKLRFTAQSGRDEVIEARRNAESLLPPKNAWEGMQRRLVSVFSGTTRVRELSEIMQEMRDLPRAISDEAHKVVRLHRVIQNYQEPMDTRLADIEKLFVEAAREVEGRIEQTNDRTIKGNYGDLLQRFTDSAKNVRANRLIVAQMGEAAAAVISTEAHVIGGVEFAETGMRAVSVNVMAELTRAQHQTAVEMRATSGLLIEAQLKGSEETLDGVLSVLDEAREKVRLAQASLISSSQGGEQEEGILPSAITGTQILEMK